MDHHPPLQRLLPHPTMQSTAQSPLVAASLLLMLIWLSAWLFQLSHHVVLVTSLLIVLLAVAVVGVRLTRRRAGPDSPRNGHRATPGLYSDIDTVNTRSASTAPMRGKRWTLDVFAHIDAQRFAAVCETWFSWAGFDTRRECHRTAQGVDIWLHAPRLERPVAFVRCKHAQNKPVELQEIREFLGIVSTCKDVHGTFTTTSTYTPEALAFANDNGIEVVDGNDLLRRILTRTRHSQEALLAVAYQGR